MNERIKIQRGLLRFDRTTVEQLAEFAGAKPSTVLNFLSAPGLCRKEYLLTEGAEQPTIIWVLLDAGREKLLADLRSFSSSSDPELDEERLDGLQRIKQGIAELEEEIGYLKTARDRDDNIPEFETRIRERLSALAVGLRGLGAWRPQPIETWQLSNLRERLEGLYT